MGVCTREDDYLRELQEDRGLAIWHVRLSNGEEVFQDDRRPGEYPASAWLRLGDYVREHKLRIMSLNLRFRTNRQDGGLSDQADGYFFVKSSLAFFGASSTIHFYLIGALQHGRIEVQRWQVPELILAETFFRDPATAGSCLITNPC
jgi:hypothetical protein